jgi:hypothetical protein
MAAPSPPSARTRSRTLILFTATAAAFVIHAGALYVPATQIILRVEPLGIDAWIRVDPHGCGGCVDHHGDRDPHAHSPRSQAGRGARIAGTAAAWCEIFGPGVTIPALDT